MSTSKKEFVCYCGSCWREDYHTNIEVDPFTRTFIVVITFGLALIFWPCRCRTCGAIRPRHWGAKKTSK